MLESTSPSPVSSPKAWSATRPIEMRTGNWLLARARCRRDRAARPVEHVDGSPVESAAPRKCQVEKERRGARTRSSTPTAPTPRAGSCSPTARRSATWNGPRPGWKAPGASCSGCGAWSKAVSMRSRPRGKAGGMRRRPALRPRDAQDDRRRHRGSRALPLQPGGRPDLRARQCRSTSSRPATDRRRGGRRWRRWSG